MISKLLKKKKKDEKEQKTQTNDNQTTQQQKSIRLPDTAVQRGTPPSNVDFGTSYPGTWFYDWPMMHRVTLFEIQWKDGFESELDVLAKLDNPFLWKIIGYYEDATLHSKCMVCLETPETIESKWKSWSGHANTELGLYLIRRATTCAKETATALQYLHSHNVIHGALSGHHIYLVEQDHEHRVKVADYGLWKIVEPTSINPRILKWAAPEVIEEKKYSFKSDVWSFGMLMWQIFSWGTEPYANLQPSEITRSILQNPLPQPTECPQIIYKLILDCCKINPEERLGFDQLVTALTLIEKQLQSMLKLGYPTLVRTRLAFQMTLPIQLGTESEYKEIGWYGPISRAGANKVLEGTPNGTYLVRWSEKEISYVLTYKNEPKPGHIFGLNPTDDGFQVKTTTGQITYDKIIFYLRKMKTLKVIDKSIHELEPEPKSDIVQNTKEDPGQYVSNPVNPGEYVNARKKNVESIYVSSNENNENNSDAGIYVHNLTSSANAEPGQYVSNMSASIPDDETNSSLEKNSPIYLNASREN